MAKSTKNCNSKHNTKGYKGKRSSGNKSAYHKREDRESPDTIITNEITWYNRVEPQFSLSTKVPFNKLSGETYPYAVPGIAYGEAEWIKESASFPYAMRIQYIPGIGVATKADDPVNIAFQKMHAAIATKTSSQLPFGVQHLAVYTICMQSIAQNIALAKRAIQLSNLWHSMNIAFPRDVMAAAGVEPSSVLNNRAMAAYRLSTIISYFNTLACPDYIDTFKRHYALCANTWMDNDSVQAQLFTFLPSIYYMHSDLGTFEEGEYNGVACAIPCAFPWHIDMSATIDFFELCDIIQEQLNAVAKSADARNIRGYLTKAFDSANLIKIDPISPDEAKPPVYDEVMLYQIHNMNIINAPAVINTENPTVWKGEKPVVANHLISGDLARDIVTYQPMTVGFSDDIESIYIGCLTDSGVLINFFDARYVGEPAMIMESTRLISNWEPTGPNVPEIRAISLGTEYVCGVSIWRNHFDEATMDNVAVRTRVRATIASYYDAEQGYPEWGTGDVQTLEALSKFHMAPRSFIYEIYRPHPDRVGLELFPVGYTGDIMYWTNVPTSTLEGLHSTALMSLYDVNNRVAVKDMK